MTNDTANTQAIVLPPPAFLLEQIRLCRIELTELKRQHRMILAAERRAAKKGEKK